MTRFLKFALVWFIALALPVQGFAAVAMLCCESGKMVSAGSQSHHSVSDIAVAVNVVSAHAQMNTDSGSDHEHDHNATAATDGAEQHEVHANADTKTKCSACAASCMSAAIVPDVFSEMPTPEPPGLTVASFYPSQFTAYIPSTPQRPPLSYPL